MHLTPRESERLMVHMMGELAVQRKERGLKLMEKESLITCRKNKFQILEAELYDRGNIHF